MASHTGDVTLDTGRATAAPVRHSGTATLYTRGCQVQGEGPRRLSGGLSKPDDYCKYSQTLLVW